MSDLSAATIEQRFWSNVDRTDSCWIWTGSRGKRGEGRFRGSRTLKRGAAHRFAYRLLVGPIPDNVKLEHLCGNVLCVNPEHVKPRTLANRFWAKVEKTETCWLWNAAHRDRQGYGAISHNGRMLQAHRVAYELLVGPIPEGLTLDHLCRVRACVNPAHLEPVTALENTQRGVRFRKGL